MVKSSAVLFPVILLIVVFVIFQAVLLVLLIVAIILVIIPIVLKIVFSVFIIHKSHLLRYLILQKYHRIIQNFLRKR